MPILTIRLRGEADRTPKVLIVKHPCELFEGQAVSFDTLLELLSFSLIGVPLLMIGIQFGLATFPIVSEEDAVSFLTWIASWFSSVDVTTIGCRGPTGLEIFLWSIGSSHELPSIGPL
jgi:hypothetical protein